MAEPSCSTCKHFDAAMRGKGGECRDNTKRIYPRRAIPSEVNPPWITDGEIFTCLNHTPREDSPNGLDQPQPMGGSGGAQNKGTK